MSYAITVQIDSDPGQPDNSSTQVEWDLSPFTAAVLPGVSGVMVVAADQIIQIANGYVSALQDSIRANNGAPNATVTLVSVVNREQVEQDTTLYPTGG